MDEYVNQFESEFASKSDGNESNTMWLYPSPWNLNDKSETMQEKKCCDTFAILIRNGI